MDRPVVDFFFDFSSPWTYLAFVQIQGLAARLGVAVNYQPILVGAIFNEVNTSVYAARASPPPPLKARYGLRDMDEWAEAYGVMIKSPYGHDPPSVFPVNSARALRGATFAERRGLLLPYCWAVFDAYWGRGDDIAQPGVLGAVAESVGLERGAFDEWVACDEAKATLRAATSECVARGGFGSPSMFVGEHLYFGNDRIPLLERRLAIAGAQGAPCAPTTATLEFGVGARRKLIMQHQHQQHQQAQMQKVTTTSSKL